MGGALLSVQLRGALQTRVLPPCGLARQAEAAGKRLPILLQVNTSGETTKSGIAPEQLPELLAACHRHPALEVVGLMAIPKASPAPDASRPDFARLRTLRDTLREEPGGASLRELANLLLNPAKCIIIPCTSVCTADMVEDIRGWLREHIPPWQNMKIAKI